MDMSRCPVCALRVPRANEDLHDLRCTSSAPPPGVDAGSNGESESWAQDVDVPFSFDSTCDRDDAGLRSRTLGLRHSHGPQATAPHRTALLSASRLQLCPTDMEFTHQGRQRMMLQASDPVFPDSSDLLALPPSVFDASPSLGLSGTHGGSTAFHAHSYFSDEGVAPPQSDASPFSGLLQQIMRLDWAEIQAQLGTGKALARLPTCVLTSRDISCAPEECRSCVVCQEDFKDGDEQRALPCFHQFHKDCIDPWLRSRGTCPLCKHRIGDA